MSYISTHTDDLQSVGEDAFTIAKVEQQMKISGISKFTHISVSEQELSFGEILVGAPNTPRAPTEKEFVLRNRSLVRASFQVVNMENDHEPVFSFSPLHGVVPPESSITIKVQYTPLSAGTFMCDHFDIVTPGGNRVRMTCKGRAMGPVVTLWKKNKDANFVPTRSINFHDIVAGKSSSRVVTLRNESAVEVAFHFACQQTGVFQFSQINGRIAPFQDRNVTITFTPAHVGNFYRRFYLLIHNQSTMALDVLGTAYDDKTRPSPFQQAHVDAYRLRAAAGLASLSPDQLETHMQQHGDDLFLQGAVRRKRDEELATKDQGAGSLSNKRRTVPATIPNPSQTLTRSGEASLAAVETCHEYFINIDDENSNPVLASNPLLEFGNCGIIQFPSKKTLHVTNNTHGKVTCCWRVAMASDATDNKLSRSFSIFPESSDINAGATVEFRVAFQPSEANTYYFAELEAYVSFKSNRTFRLVNINAFTPPWCLVVNVCGNTFASPTEQFLPKISFRLGKRQVHFPPCYLGETVFQTILMENSSDTPAMFEFVIDPSGTFKCKPQCGYIAEKSFHLVQIRFSPHAVKRYDYALGCIVNNARAKPEMLELTGICALPQLAFYDDLTTAEQLGSMASTDARIFIKPTALGLTSMRSIHLVNTSRVPLVYRWDIPRKCNDVFQVTPKLGRLNGKESVTVQCCFAPNEIRDYMNRFQVAIKPISVAWSQRNTQRKIPVLQESTVRIQTKGTIGAIAFEPENLKFETILVNTSSKMSFFIVNSADCDLNFTLQQSVLAETTRPQNTAMERASSVSTGALTFSEPQGRIHARSRKQITATFLPQVAGKFTFNVSCAITIEEMELSQSRWIRLDARNEHNCVILAEASFPTVVIEDIRIPGGSTQLGWNQFQCHHLNEYLLAPLTEEEEQTVTMGTSAGGHSADPNAEDPSIKRFALPFSPAPLGSAPERVHMKLKNPGSLVVQFRLRYPKEGNVEIEHWAETGAPSADEVRLDAILDSQVFGLSPRKATLLPHQSIILTLSYAYTSDAFNGVHDLPIYLEVDKGKRLMLEFQGRTLARNEPKLFLPQHVFYLSPVMIGEFRRFRPHPRSNGDDSNDDRDSSALNRAPVQQIQVFNRGECAFRLEIGSQAFARINRESYNYTVLHCSNSSEIIPAKSSTFIDIEFNPIEAKTWETSIILKAHGLMGKGYNEAVMLTVIATGYHPRETSLAQLRRYIAIMEPPERPLALTSDHAAHFLSEVLDFLHVPMYSQVHQVVVLRNQGPMAQRSLSFEWDSRHPLIANGLLEFTPMKGEIASGDQIIIRVCVQTFRNALVIDHDVPCLVQYHDENANETIAGASMNGSRSPLKSMNSKALETRTSGVRASVIVRSTATQEAATEKPRSKSRAPMSSLLKHTSKTNQKDSSTHVRKAVESSGLSRDEPSCTASIPLFVRIRAHVLPQAALEKTYDRETLRSLPLPLTDSARSRSVEEPAKSSGTTRPPKGSPSPALQSANDKSTCRDVIYHVMEELVLDALNSEIVKDALEAQTKPLDAPTRALRHAASSLLSKTATSLTVTSVKTPTLYAQARRSEDCQAILTSVMENTVFNIMQELFHGNDLEKELLCVPRKAVFPNLAAKSF